MAVHTTTRERLRSQLLGPLGEEGTTLLMQELDHAGLPKIVGEVSRMILEESRHTKLIVYSVCGSLALVMITALVTLVLQALGRL